MDSFRFRGPLQAPLWVFLGAFNLVDLSTFDFIMISWSLGARLLFFFPLPVSPKGTGCCFDFYMLQ